MRKITIAGGLKFIEGNSKLVFTRNNHKDFDAGIFINICNDYSDVIIMINDIGLKALFDGKAVSDNISLDYLEISKDKMIKIKDNTIIIFDDNETVEFKLTQEEMDELRKEFTK